jgi:hypothetical protein
VGTFYVHQTRRALTTPCLSEFGDAIVPTGDGRLLKLSHSTVRVSTLHFLHLLPACFEGDPLSSKWGGVLFWHPTGHHDLEWKKKDNSYACCWKNGARRVQEVKRCMLEYLPVLSRSAGISGKMHVIHPFQGIRKTWT